MEDLPLWVHATALIVLLALSAFFSIAETSMMAINRYRLGHLVKKNRRGARLTAQLLSRTEPLLGTILLGNNVINTGVTALVTSLAIRYFGNNDTVLLIATTGVALMIIIFCEITPKVIGATYPERIALPTALLLSWLIKLASPVVNLINVIAGVMLKMFRVNTGGQSTRLSTEELRSLVLESSHYIPNKHRSILVNLFDLEKISVEDVMTPRQRIEAIDISAPTEVILEQLSTCYHNKLPVFEGEVNKVIGVLHVRKTLAMLRHPEFDAQMLRELLVDPYFVPAGTPVFTQLQFFQEQRQRLALVVDEYGEVLGLVTLEDIIEEIIGEFTTQAPGASAASMRWNEHQEIIVEGGALLRELNRRLGTQFPLDGPRTLNGLVLETLQGLPEAEICVRYGNLVVEVTQIENRTIRSARLRRLLGPPGAPNSSPSPEVAQI